MGNCFSGPAQRGHPVREIVELDVHSLHSLAENHPEPNRIKLNHAQPRIPDPKPKALTPSPANVIASPQNEARAVNLHSDSPLNVAVNEVRRDVVSDQRKILINYSCIGPQVHPYTKPEKTSEPHQKRNRACLPWMEWIVDTFEPFFQGA